MGRDEGIKAGDGIWENTRRSYRMGFPALELNEWRRNWWFERGGSGFGGCSSSSEDAEQAPITAG
jgi:hypothetical protein